MPSTQTHFRLLEHHLHQQQSNCEEGEKATGEGEAKHNEKQMTSAPGSWSPTRTSMK